MKVVILAGGYGTRISEESVSRPKPMIDIGGFPILWHIMKHYSHYGFNEFVICAGYKQDFIKDYFASYFLHNSDVTFDLRKPNEFIVHRNISEPWKVTIVDTGLNTMTGGRIKRIKDYLNGERFMLTYGDGVSDIDLNALLSYHKKHGKLVTMSVCKPEGRFGVIEMGENAVVHAFREKATADVDWINVGYMVCEPEVLDYIEGDADSFETDTLPKVVKDKQLISFKHRGFWRCVDTLRDKMDLEKLIKDGTAPWMIWKN